MIAESWVAKAQIVMSGHRSIVNQVRYNPYSSLVASSGVEKVVKVRYKTRNHVYLIGLVSASVFIVDKSTKFKSRCRQLSTKQDRQKPRFLGSITIFGSTTNFRNFVKSAIFQC